MGDLMGSCCPKKPCTTGFPQWLSKDNIGADLGWIVTKTVDGISSTSLVEASQESLECIWRNNPFEVCIKTVDGISSTSLGSKRKEVQVSKENEVPDPLKRCLFCKERDTKFLSAWRFGGRKESVRRILPCQSVRCVQENTVLENALACKSTGPPLEHFDEEGKLVYIKDGVTYKERPKESEYLAPHNCANCYRLLTSRCPRCPICYKEHGWFCPYYTSVEKDAAVSPYYDIICKYCEFEVDSSLMCSRCGMEVKGRVINRLDCIVCGKPSSAVFAIHTGSISLISFLNPTPSCSQSLYEQMEVTNFSNVTMGDLVP